MEDNKSKIHAYGGDSKPEISSQAGQIDFAVEPVVEHDIYVPEGILQSNFMAEMQPETRDMLKHLSGKGALFSGFAGTGKTALIKWLAKQNNAMIIPVQRDDSNAIMDAKFKQARTLTREGKKVYVVFDEIDEFGSKEALVSDVSKISAVLRELDGINSKTNHNLYYFATTNDLPKVDQRLMRTGRLEELVEIPLPTTEQKERIIACLLKGTKYAPQISRYISLIAKKSKGHTPADLRGFLKDLSIHLSRNGQEISEEQVLERLRSYQPTAKKGFEYFKTPEFSPEALVGRELYLKFFKKTIENNPSANFLLYGPNGTGKTLMPEVLAEMLDMNYLKASGSELQEGIVGEGTKKIKRFINLAKISAPSIVLFDETEGIISRRGTISHKDDETAYLNSVLSRPIEGVYFFITTNTPHLLNETTLTRFGYKVFYELPDEKEIAEFLRKKEITEFTPESLKGYSFRDLDNIAKVSRDYGNGILRNFLAQYTPENRNRTEDWGRIKYHIGDSLELERIVQSIK